MKVILNKDIANLGEEGDIKDVARGYARNFLIPKQLVMPYTRQALSILESRRERLDQRRVEKQKAALDIKTRLEGEDLLIEMPAGDRGRLFGSVTSATIAEALAGQGITVERRRLEIPNKTIKSVGTTRVRVRLYGEEEAELKVVVRAVGSEGDGAGAAKTDAPAADAAPDAEAAVSEAPAVEEAAVETADVDEQSSDAESQAGESPAADEAENTDTDE